MAKATLKLENGTTVIIEGTPEEVQRLIDLSTEGRKSPARARRTNPPSPAAINDLSADEELVPVNEIANLAKSCDDADKIETQILDRSSQLDRVLLPLYIVHEHLKERFALTSGEISVVTKELGVPISTANASTTLSAAAAKYVMGDRVRRFGQPVRYKINRRGVAYMKSVLQHESKE